MNVAGAISNGLLGLLTALRVPPAAAGAIATSLFVALGSAPFWIGLGIVAALGGAIALAFSRGTQDVGATLTQRLNQATQDFNARVVSAAAELNIDLSSEQLAQLRGADDGAAALDLARSFGIAGTQLDAVALAFSNLETVARERMNTLNALNTLEARRVRLEEQLGDAQQAEIILDAQQAFGGGFGANLIQAIQEAGGVVDADATGSQIIAALSQLDETTRQSAIEQANLPRTFANEIQQALSSDLVDLRNTLTAVRDAIAATRETAGLEAEDRRRGGLIRQFQTGGRISGPGSGTSDSIPAMVSNGEFIVNAAATRRNIGLLTAINGGNYDGFGSCLLYTSPSPRD